MASYSPVSPGTERPLPAQAPQGSQNGWLPLLFLGFGLGYWIFAWYLERIDLPSITPQWWGILIPFPMPAIFFKIGAFFHWRVLRHFVPVFAGGWMAYEAAASLIMVLYGLPDKPSAKRYLQRLRTGVAATRPIPVSKGTLAENRQQSVLLRVGGPGPILIPRGETAVTEINGRYARILAAGLHKLARFEYIHTVIDLHPQERIAEDVELMSSDGIPLVTSLHVRFRLETGGAMATKERPFPFDPLAARIAAYAATVLADGEILSWEDLPIRIARGMLIKSIAQKPLDDILAHSSRAAEPILIIQTQVLREAREKLTHVGIELLEVHIGQLELPDEVTDQYINYWKSQSDTHIRLSLADGEATALEEIEIARAEAEVTMLQAILEGVQRTRYNNSSINMQDVVALRMVEALEKMAQQSEKTEPLPPALLPQLNSLRQQLIPDKIMPNDEV